jgi:lipoate-protein ligase A
VRGELVSDGRKLVGSAQWRDKKSLLQHGSILIDDDQSAIHLFSVGSDTQDAPPIPATLAAALGRTPKVSEVSDALFNAVRSLEDPEASTLNESDVRNHALAGLPHFQNELWTWRR